MTYAENAARFAAETAPVMAALDAIPAVLTVNDRRTIIERHHGWESASPALLARVFKTTPQNITAILRDHCAACGRHICGHSDAVFSGVIPHSEGPSA